MSSDAERRAEIAARATGGSGGRDHDARRARSAGEGTADEKPVRLSCDLAPEVFATFAFIAAQRRTNKKHLLQAIALAVTVDPDLLDRVDKALGR